MEHPDANLIRDLSDAYAKAVGPLLPDAAALVDFPRHRNVGDSVIWSGQRVLMRRLGMRVTYTCDKDSYDADRLRRRNGDGPILIHGGGNFGDLYPGFHGSREAIVEDFPASRVVQLPQTLHFGAEEALRRASDHFARHDDFTLLVRDDASLAIAREWFAGTHAVVVPDAAFALGPLSRPRAPDVDVLVLARDDIERTTTPADFERHDVEVTDWGDHDFSRVAWNARKASYRTVDLVDRGLSGRRSSQAAILRIFDGIAQQNLVAGLRTLSRGRVVITDRLHGHIMCLLLGIPHVVLDNSYGKVTSFRRRWTSESRLTHDAGDVDEAVAIARSLLRRQPS